MKNMNVSQLEQVEKIIDQLAKMKCCILRNRITDMIFSYLERNRYENQSIMNISNYLASYVERVNRVYMDLLRVQWNWTGHDVILQNSKQEVWQKFIVDDFYDVKKNIF